MQGGFPFGGCKRFVGCAGQETLRALQGRGLGAHLLRTVNITETVEDLGEDAHRRRQIRLRDRDIGMRRVRVPGE